MSFSFRFGREPHDSSRIIYAALLHNYGLGARAPQEILDRSGMGWTPQLGLNDRLNCCTVTGLANSANSQYLALGGYTIDISDQAIADLFAKASGVPGADETVLALAPGLVEQDVLDLVSTYGFGIEDNRPPEVPLPGRVYQSVDSIARCTQDLGSATLGIKLYQNDLDQFGQGPWSAPPFGDVIGRHILLTWDYQGLAGDSLVNLQTWGALQPATWEWLMARVEETWGVVWTPAPQGIDVAGLRSKLAGLE